MIFKPLKLKGLYLIEIEKKEDKRGFFARAWDTKIFEKMTLNPKVVQTNISFNKKEGTLRGMHFQKPPFAETKYVRCTRGRVFQVAIDIKKNSDTFKEWISVELSADNYKMLYVPEGFALGFQTLEDNTELCYQVSQFYTPKYESGIRWDDPQFGIKWPLRITVISEKDKLFENFNESILI